MRLLHPGFRSCDECERWMYDPKTGKREEKFGKPIDRPAGSKTPCWCCPKCDGSVDKSAVEGRQSELSDKNQKTVELYMTLHGARLDGSGLDGLAARNMGIIHSLVMAIKTKE